MVQYDTIGTRELTAEKISLSIETGITAYSGGGQANAYQLTKTINNVTIVAANQDSVKLPANFAVGTIVIVKNVDAAQTIDVFPGTGDDLGAGANTALNIAAAGACAIFVAVVENTTWISLEQ